MSAHNPYVTPVRKTEGNSTDASFRQPSVNFLGGSPLNRLSWLRTSQVFIGATLRSPATRWILFKSGQPLLVFHKDRPRGRSLARLTTADVKPLLGPEPYLGQGQTDGEIAPDGVSALEVARLRGPKIVFLGLEEPQGTTVILPPSDFSDKTEAPEVVAERIIGTPYFSLDVSDIESSALDPLLQNDELAKDGNQFKFSEGRGAMLSMSWYDAAVFAEARTIVDWNARSRVCGNFMRGSHRDQYIPSVLFILWFTRILSLGWVEARLQDLPPMGSKGGREAVPFLRWPR